MKLAYSHLKSLVRGLNAKPEAVAEVLSMIGYMVDGVEKKGNETIWSLEVRQNRGDCLSVFGLAREVATYYKKSLNFPAVKKFNGKGLLNIKVDAKTAVRQIRAIRFSAVNQASPKWLVDWLGLYDMKSINLLVDLSNYVMMLTGYPSHLIDAKKLQGNLRWAFNPGFNSLTTLDGTEIELKPKQELLIVDNVQPIAMAGLIGAVNAEISLASDDIILEMALYDPGVTRRDARAHSIVTEAGIRLTKDLSQGGLDYAFELLVNLLIKEAKAKNLSKVYSYGQKITVPKPIIFDPAKVSSFAGVKISSVEAVATLERLGCKLSKKGKLYSVVIPARRSDLENEEDLIEEVIRFYGFYNIPSVLPALVKTNNLTPKIFILKEKLRDWLAANSYDEILSQPLVSREANKLTNYLAWKSIETQNAINEEYPALRQSVLAGLLSQVEKFEKKNVAYINIFEIGKVFGQVDNKYLEHESLGLVQRGANLDKIKDLLERLLGSLGVSDISYRLLRNNFSLANPHNSWSVVANDSVIGIMAKLKSNIASDRLYALELDLEKLLSVLPKTGKGSAAVYELIGKLVVLDANLEAPNTKPVLNLLNEVKAFIPKQNLWDIAVVDSFAVKDKIRYTIRVSYKGLGDKEAKTLHDKVFKK